MTSGDIVKEVQAALEAAINARIIVKPAWLTHEIVATHPEISGPDTDWYAVCAQDHIRDVVRMVMAKNKKTADDDASDSQLTLPGCERMQKAYVVSRDGEMQYVPIELLSKGEIDAKIAEKQAMAAGNIKHAEELMRYRDIRFGSASAGVVA